MKHVPQAPDTTTREDWRDQAACKGTPTSWWFAGDSHNVDYDIGGKYQRELCAGCPARDSCRDYYLALPDWADRHGFVAGMSPAERWARRNGEASPPVCENCHTPFVPPRGGNTHRARWCSVECRFHDTQEQTA